MSATVVQLDRAESRTKGLSPIDWNLAGVLVLVTVALYFRAVNFSFINYDDQLYVYSNIHVQQGLTAASFGWAMKAELNGNWHPLTCLVQVMIAGMFGVKAWAYHAVNIALHAANVVLLYLFFRRATGRIWLAFFTALLWGLHPLRVESVAWVSELKDVLCGAFWIGCMLAYVHYARRRTFAGLALVYLLQTLSLLGKPMAVTLPFALLLLDWWPLGRAATEAGSQPAPSGSPARWWCMRVLEKLPMAPLCVGDIFMQENKISFTSPGLPFGIRVQNSLVSTAAYVRDTFFPWHLGVFYPHPCMFRHVGEATHIPAVQIIASTALLVLVSLAVLLRVRRQPYLAVGWFWFLGTLVPVIGLSQVGEQARADRFTYLPSIGICMAVVWWVGDLCAARRIYRNVAAIGGCVTAIVLIVVSSMDLGYWKNAQSLFGHLLQIQPNNFLAMSVKCEDLAADGDLPRAIAMGKRAIEISPGSPRAHKSYGNALQLTGEYEKAAEQFQTAVALDKDDAASWDALGRVRDVQAGQYTGKNEPMETAYRLKAIADFRNAISADPDEFVARDHLAYQLALLGKFDEAIPIWEEAVALAPAYGPAHGDLADALLLKKDVPGAIMQYQAAIDCGAKDPAWEAKLAWLVAINPQFTAQEVQPMIAIAKDACDQTQNRDVPALDAYAACLARVGIFDDAVATEKQAVAQANAAHNPALAKALEKRLALYDQQKVYTVEAGTTQPVHPATTTP
jgi:tetratricopeptide (TPR) repeat protein